MPRALLHEFEPEAGARLRGIRQHLKLTAEVFAAALEISRGYLSELENSKRLPGKTVLSALHRVYQVPPEYVVKGTGPMFEEAGEATRSSLGSAGKQVYRAGAHAVVDTVLLKAVVDAVLSQLKVGRPQMPTAKLSEIAALAYEHAAALHFDPGRDQAGIRATVKRFVKLAQ